ncbi:MAG: 16S rRNA (guanine(527)-N(7))-methyltransferase RsmG [Chloroflexi bacterium]|nr:16S rRNA (guanine(527)-N(7))-methyltransferase RsmG [Chloroflexota bacterium]
MQSGDFSLLEAYAREVAAWGAGMNLVGRVDPPSICSQILDSLIGLLEPFPVGARVVDIGSGAGLPAIPIRVARQDIHLSLIESSQRKIGFLRHVINLLNLSCVGTLPLRAEDLGQGEVYREHFERASSRGVASLPVLLELALPLLAVGGSLLAWKGPGVYEEIEAATEALSTLGGEVERIRKVPLPGSERSTFLLLVRKVAETPLKYPRRPGYPQKHPLQARRRTLTT